ncbi:MAG: hypothetical protein ACI90U_002511 [Pseudomonadales bacterium]|jgi:hypothetical protein
MGKKIEAALEGNMARDLMADLEYTSKQLK